MHADGLCFVFLTQAALEDELAVLEELRREGYPGDVRGAPGRRGACARACDRRRGGRRDPDAGRAPRAARDADRGARRRASRPRSRDPRAHRGDRAVGLGRGLARCAPATTRCAPTVSSSPAAHGQAASCVRSACASVRRRRRATASPPAERGRGPSRPLYLGEAKVGCSPFDGGVRLAGTLELAGIDLSLHPRRLAAVGDARRRTYLKDWRPDRARARVDGPAAAARRQPAADRRRARPAPASTSPPAMACSASLSPRPPALPSRPSSWRIVSCPSSAPFSPTR